MTKYSPRHAGRPTKAPVASPDSSARPTAARRVWFSAPRRPLLGGITTLAVVAAVSGGVVASPAGSLAAGTRGTSERSSASTSAALTQAAAARAAAALAHSKAIAVHQRAAATATAAAAASKRRASAARASRSLARARLEARNPQLSARSQAASRGWGAEQFSCLDSLWRKESGWEHTADNPTSSAFGIPQALPGSKMASAGSDWRTNPVTQIRWGLGYIESRYGTPCAAWRHSQANNWY